MLITRFNNLVKNFALKLILCYIITVNDKVLFGRISINHYVYKITNNINNKKYIGKRSCNCPIEEDKYMGSGKLLKQAFKKYGIENFSKKILKICESEDCAFKWEEIFIEEAKAYSNDSYYNIASEGQGGFRNFAGKSEEELLFWRKRMSESRKGRIITEEWKAKILKTKKEKKIGHGNTNGMYGRKGDKSPVSKAIMMIDFKGNIVNSFDSASDVNKYLNKKGANRLISRICNNKYGTAYGYLWLFEKDYNDIIENNTFDNWLSSMIKKYMKKKEVSIVINYSKAVFQLDKDTLEIINSFESAKEASDFTGIRLSSITRNCNHDCNTAEGFSWILQDEYYTLSKEELKKLYKKTVSEKHKTSVYCLTTNQKFDSIKDAREYFNLSKSAKISDVCKGIRKKAGNHPVTGEPLTWIFYNEY